MKHYQHVHTSDLSATMAASSVALALDPQSSVERNYDGRKRNLGVLDPSAIVVLNDMHAKGRYPLLIDTAECLLEDAPKSIFLLNILAETNALIGQREKAVHYYTTLLETDPHHSEVTLKLTYLPNVHNNLSISLKEMGFLEQAEHHVSEAIRLRPNCAIAYNTYGTLLNEMANLSGARQKLLRSIELNPKDHTAYWNLQSTVSDPEHAKEILRLYLAQTPDYQMGVVTLAGLNALTGDTQHYDYLMEAGFANDPLMRSITWALSLSNDPELHFNRWSVFDRAIEWSSRNRPFYEFGVWMGDSFKYIKRSFEKGYGFDTFSGLPEDWRSVPQGSYSSFGRIPRIEGAEFIAGDFTETLPKFFEKPRSMAALMNFDADLYSSTLCALTHARPVIDDQTVLIFDEFIVNADWEQDEYRALNDFCKDERLDYEVLAFSLYTKQVVCRLTGL